MKHVEDWTRFPEALRASARPRWSHRDPVEGGNPFPEGDPRRHRWTTATAAAVRELVGLDARLDAEEREGTARAPYPTRVVDLAVCRYDIWARRGLTAVASPASEADYRQWLIDYAENWLRYVEDTCPTLRVGETLEVRLSERASTWTDEARSDRQNGARLAPDGDGGPRGKA